jgi:hypothetical protein
MGQLVALAKVRFHTGTPRQAQYFAAWPGGGGPTTACWPGASDSDGLGPGPGPGAGSPLT